MPVRIRTAPLESNASRERADNLISSGLRLPTLIALARLLPDCGHVHDVSRHAVDLKSLLDLLFVVATETTPRHAHRRPGEMQVLRHGSDLDEPEHHTTVAILPAVLVQVVHVYGHE